MKNIHISPTNKPSRISILNSGKLDFGAEIMSSSNSKPQHIYITSDEEIKERDYCISHLNIIDEGKIHNSQTVFNPKTKEHLIALKSCKKIILTTDQDLIKDGVQAIDNDFLEWFVKNPSCEEVEVELVTLNEYGSEVTVNSYGFEKFAYKIIIPKKEMKDKEKQRELIVEIMKEDEESRLYDEPRAKLYTEEQVRNAISLATCTDIDYQYILDLLTPIELPSDEEIMQIALENTADINTQIAFNNGAVYICKLIEGHFNTKEK